MEENYFTRPEIAQVYDGYIGKNMPFYWSAIHYLADAVQSAFQDKEISRALEIGVGSGNLSLSLLQRAKVKHLTIMDHSREFLRLASQKILEQPEFPAQGLRLCLKSFSKPKWSEDIPHESYELVLSSFTFDHIADEHLPSIYDEIASLIMPGGIFTLAEKCAGGGKEGGAWKSYVRSIDLRTEHNRKHRLKTEEEIVEWRRHNFEDDQMRSLLMHIRELERAGFKILKIGGLILPTHDVMHYDDYYKASSVADVSRAHLQEDQAMGAGLLVCQKL